MSTKINFTINAVMLLRLGLLCADAGHNQEFLEVRSDAFNDLIWWLPVDLYYWDFE